MIEPERSFSPRDLALALPGPILAGAILGLRFGPKAMLVLALGLPAIALGVSVLTAPAFYVGGTLMGWRMSPGEVATAFRRGLRALALCLFGLAPLEVLLSSTLTSRELALVAAALVVSVAAAVAWRRMMAELPPTGPLTARMVVSGVWTLVAVVIAGRLFVEVLKLGGLT